MYSTMCIAENISSAHETAECLVSGDIGLAGQELGFDYGIELQCLDRSDGLCGSSHLPQSPAVRLANSSHH